MRHAEQAAQGKRSEPAILRRLGVARHQAGDSTMAEPSVRMPGIVLASLMFQHVNSDSDVVSAAPAPHEIICLHLSPLDAKFNVFFFFFCKPGNVISTAAEVAPPNFQVHWLLCVSKVPDLAASRRLHLWKVLLFV